MAFQRENKTGKKIFIGLLVILLIGTFWLFGDLEEQIEEQKITKGYKLNAKF